MINNFVHTIYLSNHDHYMIKLGHETFEDLEIPDAVQVDIAYDIKSAMCYSLDPIVEEVDKELGILSVDSSGYMQMF